MKDHHGKAPSIGAKGMQLGRTNRGFGEHFDWISAPELFCVDLVHTLPVHSVARE